MNAADVRARFQRCVTRPEPEIDLAEAALLIGLEDAPELAVEPYLARLGALAARVLAVSGPRPPDLAALNRVLFDEEGFVGDRESYYDPENSFLHCVLDRRKGIPITLALVFLEVGRRAGLALLGVGFPGHFLVKQVAGGEETVIDPFSAGKVLSRADCQERLDGVYGGKVRFQPEFLAAAGPRQILLRILNNLKRIYVNGEDFARALGVVERVFLVDPEATREVRDRGMIRYRLGDLAGAIADLKRYLGFEPPAEEADLVRETIKTITKVMARLN